MPATRTPKAPRPRSPRRVKGTDKIPRPLNKFFLFKQDFIARYPEPRPANKVMVAHAGSAWARITAKEMVYWTRVQAQVAAEHARKYPGYKYAPVRKGGKKAMAAAEEVEVEEAREMEMRPWGDVESRGTPSVCAASLGGTPESSLRASPSPPPPYFDLSLPASTLAPAPPPFWDLPNGGPDDAFYLDASVSEAWQPLPQLDFDFDAFESQAPSMFESQGNDWMQAIDPQLLALGPMDCNEDRKQAPRCSYGDPGIQEYGSLCDVDLSL